MKVRAILRGVSVLLFLDLLLVAAVGSAAEPQSRTARPNIVFVFIDDMGYGDLSCTGNTDVKTGNIDRLASEGTRFGRFYVNSPICSPSRVAVTTGQYPARHLINSFLATRKRNRARGMRDFLDPRVPCVARTFKDAGYSTAHFGKWHMGGGRDVDDAPLPQAYGFDESLVSFEGLGDRVLPPGGARKSAQLGRGKILHAEKHQLTETYVDRSIDFIRRNRERSFYLHLWLNDVHDAHRPRVDQLEKYERFKENHYVQKFYAVLVEMDRQIGRLVQEIDSLGLAERTLIVLTSDNGPTAWAKYYREGFDPPGSTDGDRGRKWSLYEGGIRMPLIVRWKGTVPAGKIEDESTILAAIDLFPSFCSLAGVAPPDVAFDGEDMSEAFRGGRGQRTKMIFWEYGRDGTYLRPGLASDRSPNLAIRDGDWKLLVNADGSGAELYDFSVGTSERRPVTERYPDVARRLTRRVLEWRRSLPVLGKE